MHTHERSVHNGTPEREQLVKGVLYNDFGLDTHLVHFGGKGRQIRATKAEVTRLIENTPGCDYIAAAKTVLISEMNVLEAVHGGEPLSFKEVAPKHYGGQT